MNYYDLQKEAQRPSIGNVVARENDLKRIARTLQRQYNNNIIVHGPSGVGKTALIEGFAYRAALGKIAGFSNHPMLKLDTAELKRFLLQQNITEVANHISNAFRNIPGRAAIYIDDFHMLLFESRISELSQIFDPFFERNDLQLILSMAESGYQLLLKDNPNFCQNFDEIAIGETDKTDTETILAAYAPAFEKEYILKIHSAALTEIVELTTKINSDKKMPLRAIHFLDECLAYVKISGKAELAAADVKEVYSEKTGIPSGQLSSQSLATLKNLESALSAKVIGQPTAIRLVANTVRRSRMGLRNPQKPHGSFLFLGPSGVGKTELSRVLAQNVYGSEKAFTRMDMSEFSEAHTVQRLIGAPPGYIGFESGGQLTNAIKARPYSLVLLDEIEKAHPRIFDIFLQVFEDGRLSDGQGQLVSFTNSIIIATSNLGINQIVQAFNQGKDLSSAEFLETELLPILAQHFRLEFLNRFDAIIVFQPLSAEKLLEIALLEVAKIEERTKAHAIKFNIDPGLLAHKIQTLADPRFGARPIKRFVEQTCESLIAVKIMHQL